MAPDRPTIRYHSTRFSPPAPCQHCDGRLRHERWCIMVNRNVYYAYLIVSEPDKLTFRDELMLHSLGVRWTAEVPAEISSR